MGYVYNEKLVHDAKWITECIRHLEACLEGISETYKRYPSASNMREFSAYHDGIEELKELLEKKKKEVKDD